MPTQSREEDALRASVIDRLNRIATRPNQEMLVIGGLVVAGIGLIWVLDAEKGTERISGTTAFRFQKLGDSDATIHSSFHVPTPLYLGR